MQNPTRPLQVRLFQIVPFVAWTLLFAVAYAQSPLYTSNQNQYFLHGLAKAGYGTLQRDWLANTLDPTPVFSLLVYLTYRFLRLEELFYVTYALLMGIYLFSLLGIIQTVVWTEIASPLRLKTRALLSLSLLVLIHSAGLRFALSRTLGTNWTYVLEDGVADQRLLGPVFQPSAFGVLLLLSIVLFLRGRPYLAVLSGALAATFHPTYLLSAALLTLGYMLVTLLEERDPAKSLSLGLLALVSVAPILVYVYRSFGGTQPEAMARAQAILVNFRIPHHAVAGQWLDATVVVKALLIGAALYLARRTWLFPLLLVLALAAFFLTAAQVLLASNALALLFPWRVTTFLMPVAVAAMTGWAVDRGIQTLEARASLKPVDLRRLLLASSAALVLAPVLVGAVRFKLDLDRKAASPERLMETYLAGHKKPGDVYLIPVKLQDFRLAAGAPAYVDFKSIPYQDTDVLEWYRRVQLADRFYKQPSCELLLRLAGEGVTHVILNAEESPLKCPFLEETYRDGEYAAYFIQSLALLE